MMHNASNPSLDCRTTARHKESKSRRINELRDLPAPSELWHPPCTPCRSPAWSRSKNPNRPKATRQHVRRYPNHQILVVDDSPENRMLLDAYLKGAPMRSGPRTAESRPSSWRARARGPRWTRDGRGSGWDVTSRRGTRSSRVGHTIHLVLSGTSVSRHNTSITHGVLF